MATSNKRQFVWARRAGVIGPGSVNNVFAQDLLSTVRDRFGDSVARGATVMGIRGYARPNPQGDTQPLRYRFACRVIETGAIDDAPVDVRELGPFFSPESRWMLFHQTLTAGDQSVPPASSTEGSQWHVATDAARKFPELGVTLAVFADVQATDGTPVSTGVFDYDLSIGLKLA